jgi:type I restriction enzyme S subunit
MNAERLLKYYERITDAPDAIARLRRFILDLAVRGKLVPQEPGDEPAGELLKRIAAEKARLINAGEIRKEKPLPQLRDDGPFELPFGWAWTRLGTVIHLLSGQHLQPSEYSHDPGSGVPYITGPSDFGDSGLEITKFALVRKAVAKKGQLLLTVKGAGVGKTAICGIDEVAISRQLMALTAIGWELGFLVLVTHMLADTLQERARSLIPGISREDVDEFVIGLPPLAEQRRIVAKVDELMAFCDRLEAARAKREAVRDRLAAASLARLNAPDPETFHSDARFALDALPAFTARPDQIRQIRQTILNLAVRGGLSNGGSLQETKLESVATLQNGYAFKSEWFSKTGTRLLRNANVGHGVLDWGDEVRLPERYVSEYERFRLCEGDIVLSLDRPFIVTGTKVARVSKADLPALLLQRVGRFVLSGKVHADYLLLWINSPHFSEQIDPGRSNGVPHISSKQVEAAMLFLPPLAEQHRIVVKVDALMALCDQLEASLNAAAVTRGRLLDALLAEALTPAGPAVLHIAG